MMNRFILALAAAASLALTVGCSAPAAQTAQNAPNASGGFQGQQGAGARQQFSKMLVSLNLSDDQKTQIRSIMATARAKAKTQTDVQDKRATLRDANKSVEQVLTPPQLTKLHAERAAYFKEHG